MLVLKRAAGETVFLVIMLLPAPLQPASVSGSQINRCRLAGWLVLSSAAAAPKQQGFPLGSPYGSCARAPLPAQVEPAASQPEQPSAQLGGRQPAANAERAQPFGALLPASQSACHCAANAIVRRPPKRTYQ